MPYKHYLYVALCLIFSVTYAYFIDTKALLHKIVEATFRFVAGSALVLLSIEIFELTNPKLIGIMCLATTVAIDKFIVWFIKFVEDSLKEYKTLKDFHKKEKE